MHAKSRQHIAATEASSQESETEPWVNTVTACHHLAISVPTLRRWIKDGRIQPKRTPTGELRFRISELDRLIG